MRIENKCFDLNFYFLIWNKIYDSVILVLSVAFWFFIFHLGVKISMWHSICHFNRKCYLTCTGEYLILDSYQLKFIYYFLLELHLSNFMVYGCRFSNWLFPGASNYTLLKDFFLSQNIIWEEIQLFQICLECIRMNLENR